MPVETSKEMNELFSALAHPFRRYTLSFLLNDRRHTTLHQLAKNVAETESGETDIGHIEMVLHHNHLPRLDAAGLVSYDTTTNHVEANTALEHGGLLKQTLSGDATSSLEDTL